MKWRKERDLRELWVESESRELSEKDSDRLARLSDEMPMLTEALRAESMTMNLLRSEAETPELSDDFNRRTLRIWQVERERGRLRYWTPALCGAAVTALALFTVLQLIQPRGTQTWQQPNSEARNTVAQPIIFPDYNQIKNR
jgi:hypothetical protein